MVIPLLSDGLSLLLDHDPANLVEGRRQSREDIVHPQREIFDKPVAEYKRQHGEYKFLPGWLEKLFINLLERFCRLLNNVELAAQASDTNNVKGDLARPRGELNNTRALLIAVFSSLNLVLQGLGQDLGLAHYHGVKFFDVPEVEGRHGVLAKELVLVPLDHNKPIAKNKAQEVGNPGGLRKIVAAVDKKVCQQAGICDNGLVATECETNQVLSWIFLG